MSPALSYHPPVGRPLTLFPREPIGRRRRLATGRPVAGRPARWRLLLVAPAVIGLALAAAACGDGPPKAGVASLGTTTTVVPATAAANGGRSANGAVELARCMRSHGVLSFPDPASLATSSAIRAWKTQVHESVASLASSPKFQAAQRACAKYWPADDIAPSSQPPRDAEASRRIPLHARPRRTELSRPQSHHRRAQCPCRHRQELPDSPRSPTSVQLTRSGCWSRAS